MEIKFAGKQYAKEAGIKEKYQRNSQKD
jgi:hypothetical protein